MKKILIEDCDITLVRARLFDLLFNEWFKKGTPLLDNPSVYLEDANTGERTAMESIELIDGEIIIKHQ